jgi:putative glutamine amidotransferase
MPPRRPVIGIPTQTLHAIEGIPERLPASWVMNQRYFLTVTAAGAVPWMVPLLADDRDTLREIYDRLDGVLLAGGVDVDPATYGAERRPACGVSDPARDAVELQLTRWALEDDKPLFGICRGLQVLNVARGGTLLQDIASERPASLKHDYLPTAGWSRDHLAHPVTLAEDSALRRALPAATVPVNSMHHQGIDRLGGGLRPTALAPDGLVEGIEVDNGGYAVAVQWHPEAMGAEHAARLLAPFLTAAGR